MKKEILFIACIFMFLGVKGQKKQAIYLKLIQPGIEYQYAIKNDLLTSVDIGFGLLNLSYNSSDNFDAYVSSFSNISLRKVYNHRRVMNKNIKLLSHSGNYYGLRCLAYNKSIVNRSDGKKFNYSVGPVWGAQRYFKNLYYQFELGLGYHKGYSNNQIAPMVRFCVGICLKQW